MTLFDDEPPPSTTRQPDTTPLPEPRIKDGRCVVHDRWLSYPEQRAGRCSWCVPTGEGEP